MTDGGPRWLKDEALSRGVSERCWKAGADAACRHCRDIVLAIMDERYGNVPPDRLRTIIYTDIIDGRL